MRAKFINEFTRGSDPLVTLGIGYKAKIYKFFDDIGVFRRDYIIDDKIYFGKNLNFRNCNITWLPDNLVIKGNCNVHDNHELKKLPNKLHIKGDLDIRRTSITELPHDIIVNGYIWIQENQKLLSQYLIENNWYSKTKYLG